jgi:hypothetical protein
MLAVVVVVPTEVGLVLVALVEVERLRLAQLLEVQILVVEAVRLILGAFPVLVGLEALEG